MTLQRKQEFLCFIIKGNVSFVKKEIARIDIRQVPEEQWLGETEVLVCGSGRAGVAAALSVRQDLPLSQLDVTQIQQRVGE